VPDLAVEDDRRALRAPAVRARHPAAQVTPLSPSVPFTRAVSVRAWLPLGERSS
jgi:hypothetical protein